MELGLSVHPGPFRGGCDIQPSHTYSVSVIISSWGSLKNPEDSSLNASRLCFAPHTDGSMHGH